YADELLAALDGLPGWPERVKTMQANWIGKSYGVRFAFPYELEGRKEKLWVFTTRAAFVQECRRGSVMETDLATAEKKGMPTGISVIHPLSGEPVPVWVGNYVLMTYGEGAVMGVPGHDQRDFEFAQKYHLPIKAVIRPKDGELKLPFKEAYVDYGACFNSGQYDGLD